MGAELDQWSSPVDGARWLRTWRVGEWLREPVSPLFATLLLPALAESREAGGGVGVGAPLPPMWRLRRPSYCLVNGYYFARVDPDPWSVALLPLRFVATELRGGWIERWWRSIRPAYVEVLERAAAVLRSGDSVQILEQIHRLVPAAAKVWYVLALSAGGSIPLRKFLGGVAGQGADPADLAALTAGFDTAIQREQQSLFAIAQAIREASWDGEVDQNGLGAFLTDGGAPDARSATLRNLLLQHVEEFGHLVESLDFRVPTSAEQPDGLGTGIKCYLQNARSPDESFQRTLKQRHRATKRVCAGLHGGKLRLFERLLQRAQAYASVQADAAFQLQRAWPLFRLGLLRLGAEYTQRGLLCSREDVFFLEAKELHASGSLGVQREELQQRRSVWDARCRLLAPSSIPPVADPAWDSAMRWPLDMRGESLLQRTAGRKLFGTGASAGRARGRARVLGFASQIHQLLPGEILVTAATTPHWTPAFAGAMAVVTDVGGLASHASIVAREFGIPAVVGTREGTRCIATGDWLAVDGLSGVVEVCA